MFKSHVLLCLVFALTGYEVFGVEDVSTADNHGNSRIVSGWPAAEGQFPYMLYIRGVTNIGILRACAGSIIHQNWGLTSARCTAMRVVLMIRAGSVDINRPRVYMETRSYFINPGFIEELHAISQPNDISVVRFDRNLQFNEFIQPVRLQTSADMNRDYSGITMTTAGWGTTWTEGEASDTLNWVHLRGVTNLVCLLLFNSNFLVQASTICAGPYNVTSQSICSGDSGVPLTMMEGDGRPTQVGIGSFVIGRGCHVGFPSAFVRPGHYQAWIRQVTGINFDRSLAQIEETVPLTETSDFEPIKLY